MMDKILRWCHAQSLIAPGMHIVCAVSGGADSVAMLHVLYSLRDFPNCTQKTICEQYGLPKQTVHNIVSAWQRAGYLTLAPGGREKIIRLTETGRRYAARIMQPLEEAEEQSVVRTGADALRRMTDEALQYGALLCAIMADAQE